MNEEAYTVLYFLFNSLIIKYALSCIKTMIFFATYGLGCSFAPDLIKT